MEKTKTLKFGYKLFLALALLIWTGKSYSCHIGPSAVNIVNVTENCNPSGGTVNYQLSLTMPTGTGNSYPCTYSLTSVNFAGGTSGTPPPSGSSITFNTDGESITIPGTGIQNGLCPGEAYTVTGCVSGPSFSGCNSGNGVFDAATCSVPADAGFTLSQTSFSSTESGAVTCASVTQGGNPNSAAGWNWSESGATNGSVVYTVPAPCVAGVPRAAGSTTITRTVDVITSSGRSCPVSVTQTISWAAGVCAGCPTVTVAASGSSTICSGDAAPVPPTPTLSSGTIGVDYTISWSAIANTNTTCAPVTTVYTPTITCLADGSAITGGGSYTVTVDPQVQSPVTLASGCAVTITGACPSDIVTITSTPGTGTVTGSGTNSATYTAVSGDAPGSVGYSVGNGTSCPALTGTTGSPACGMTSLSITDPCICNNDFTGAGTGTFSDVLTITTSPATPGLDYSTNSTCVGCIINSILDNTDGTYTVSVTFNDRTPYDFTADCGGCTINVLTQHGGNCAYEDGSLNSCSPVCSNLTALNVFAFPTGGTWSANAPSGVLDPSVEGVGTHTVTYTYNTYDGACPRTLSTDVVVDECCNLAIVSDCSSACTWNGTSGEYTVTLTVTYSGLSSSGDNLQLQLNGANLGAPVTVGSSSGTTTFTATLPADGALDGFAIVGTNCSSLVYNITAPADCPPPACAPNAAGTFGTGN